MSRSPRLLRTQAGSLLIVTLWIVTILTVLVVAIARTLSLEVRLTKYSLAREQARALARSGVYLAMERLKRDVEPDNKSYDWLEDDWAGGVQQVSGTDPHASVEIAIVDAERALDVNAATVDQLTQLSGSSDVAHALVDYRDQDQEGAWEAVMEEHAYYPKNGPLIAPEELREIPGQTTETLEALEQFTVAVPEPAPRTKVNVNTASREVLRAVGLPRLAQEILQFRADGHYFTALAPTLVTESPTVPPPFDPAAPEFLNAQPALQVYSDTFEIHATGRLNNPKVRYRINAVVKRTGCPTAAQTPCIVAWREG